LFDGLFQQRNQAMYSSEKMLVQLFGCNATRPLSFIDRIRQRNKRQLVGYTQWLLSDKYKGINEAVKGVYCQTPVAEPWFAELHVFDTASANGFTLVFNEAVESNEPQYYFDYLKNRVLAFGCQLQHSYRELTDQTLHVETVDKYFFQLPAKKGNSKRSEKSNDSVTMEFITINNVPSHFKFMFVASDSSRLYPSVAFGKLLDTLFEF
jgi:hypothetical protein